AAQPCRAASRRRHATQARHRRERERQMTGWKWHPPKGSGPVQQHVKQIVTELGLKEFSTREVMEAAYPRLCCERSLYAYYNRRRRLRIALHDIAVPIARDHNGYFWRLK